MASLEKAKELHAEASERFKHARQIWDQKLKGERHWGADDEQTYDRTFSEAQELLAKADKEKKTAELEASEERLKAFEERLQTTGNGRRSSPDARDLHNVEAGNPDKPLRFELIRSYRGRAFKEVFEAAVGTPEHRRHLPENRDAYRSYLEGNRNAIFGTPLQTDFEQRAGYLVMPEVMVGELLQTLDDSLWMRRLARTFTVRGAQSLGVIKRTAQMSTFAWGEELVDTEALEDTSLAFGKRHLIPHYMAGQVKASRDLLRNSMIPVDSFLMGEISRDAGELEEDAFLLGDGAQKPLGIFVASADGISTGRDVQSTNTTTAIVADALRDTYYSLKERYRRMASWLFHRDTVKMISKLKTGDGTNSAAQYYWQPGISVNDQPTILGRPVIESERVPNTYEADAYVGMLADFSYYWIADNLGLDVQFLSEYYAKTNSVAWVIRRKVDGAPQLEEAFARMQLGS